LEQLLIGADIGVPMTRSIMQNLQKKAQEGALSSGAQLKQALGTLLIQEIERLSTTAEAPITIVVGINGSGKTTFVAKLARYFIRKNERVMIAAADTFRAAAVQQLEQWASAIGATIVAGEPQQDPAAVVFKAIQLFKQGQYDRLIIDTAGRLQTKLNLMQELAKIGRVLQKNAPDTPINTFLTVDAMLGQNSFEQARLFNEATKLNGIILTKMDTTAKGGIVFSIAHALKVPVVYLSTGEDVESLQHFIPADFVRALLTH
jgi:fused signal recognition particle receptor